MMTVSKCLKCQREKAPKINQRKSRKTSGKSNSRGCRWRVPVPPWRSEMFLLDCFGRRSWRPSCCFPPSNGWLRVLRGRSWPLCCVRCVTWPTCRSSSSLCCRPASERLWSNWRSATSRLWISVSSHPVWSCSVETVQVREHQGGDCWG